MSATPRGHVNRYVIPLADPTLAVRPHGTARRGTARGLWLTVSTVTAGDVDSVKDSAFTSADDCRSSAKARLQYCTAANERAVGEEPSSLPGRGPTAQRQGAAIGVKSEDEEHGDERAWEGARSAKGRGKEE